MASIEIRIAGDKNGNELTPDNFDIKEIKLLMESIEDMLYPISKKGRPDITYSIEQGSVKNIFKTSLPAVAAFSAVMSMVNEDKSIDRIDLTIANAIEKIQETASKTKYVFEIKTSQDTHNTLTISPETNYKRTNDNVWVEAEFYLYGTLTNAGGKDKSNIHIDTDELGSIIIATDRNLLKQEEKNLLYKELGVRVLGRQNKDTGEIDKSEFHLKEIIDYSPQYDEDYINNLIHKVGDTFDGLDIDEWISEIRGRR